MIRRWLKSVKYLNGNKVKKNDEIILFFLRHSIHSNFTTLIELYFFLSLVSIGNKNGEGFHYHFILMYVNNMFDARIDKQAGLLRLINSYCE